MVKKKETPAFRLSDLEKINLASSQDEIDLDLDADQRKRLSPEANELLSREKVRRAVREFGADGLTVEEIAKLTGLTSPTITKHLSKLVGLREVYAQKKNNKLTLFYANGKPLHHLGVRRLDFDNPIIEVCLAEGPKNRAFYYILEKRYTILDGETPEGAVMIPEDRLDEFIAALQELRSAFGGDGP